MTRKQKKVLLRILISAALLAGALAFPSGFLKNLLFFASYALIGWDVLWRAIRNISHGQVFDENFLMALATIGAFFYRGISRRCCSYAVLSSRGAVPKLCRRPIQAVDFQFNGYPA